MKITYPHTIENGLGEKKIFHSIQKEPDSDRVIVEKFDAVYLVTRYSKEYDIPEIPAFVKKTIMPMTCIVGRMLGKYKKFEDTPEPVTK